MWLARGSRTLLPHWLCVPAHGSFRQCGWNHCPGGSGSGLSAGKEARVSGFGCSWNHGCRRTSELPGRRDEGTGGPYPRPGRGRGLQDQSPFISPPVISVAGPGPLTSRATEVRASHLTSLPLENLLGSFSLFLLKARAPYQLQPGLLLALPLGLVPFNSSEGPRPSSQPPPFSFLLPHPLSLWWLWESAGLPCI